MSAYQDIERQVRKNAHIWGGYERTPAEHLLIATEELGEVARAMQTPDPVGGRYQWPPQYSSRVYAELVDLGAVIVAMMQECDE